MLSKEVFAYLNKSEFYRNWRITMKKNYSRLSLLFTFLSIIIIFIGIKQSFIVMFLGIVLLIAAFVIGAIAVVKRERSSLIIWSLFIIFLFILPFAKPSNASFTDWLAVQHQFDCQDKACVSNTEVEKVVDRKSEDYFFFNKKSIKLEDEKGRLFLIEGIGILGGYTTLTYKPVFE